MQPFHMVFRFRQTVRLFPGVRLNISKGGISVSAGVPGSTLNFGRHGTALTVGLPGTGMSYRTQLTGGRRGVPPSQTSFPDTRPKRLPNAPSLTEPTLSSKPPLDEIRSADIATLTTPDLLGLKQLLSDAARQRSELEHHFRAAMAVRERAWVALRRAEQFPLSLFSRRRLPDLRAAFLEAETEASDLIAAHAATQVGLDFALDQATANAFVGLEDAHAALVRCAAVWDITASIATDRIAERTLASAAVTRKLVQLGRSHAAIVSSQWSALRFENANGEDIEILPGLCLLRQPAGNDYALIDLRQLRLEYSAQNFLEEEALPRDAQKAGTTWKKVNRDGSPDRRFRNNFQIPVARYGRLDFTTPNGVSEAYLVSDAAAAEAFAKAYHGLQEVLHAVPEDLGAVPAAQPSVEAGLAHTPLRQPTLPQVPAAHEVTVGMSLGLAACAALAWFTLQAPTPTQETLGSVAMATPAVMQEGVQAPHLAEENVGPAGPPPIAMERVVTRQAANVRAEANGNAPVLRTAPTGTELQVFQRRGTWVQVGLDDPVGWIHGSLLTPAP